ncbi:hypothetical protein EVAR_88610_1 [Eumeta japonica]|uniref:Uncharacterized protein n=1 Tax=Eumeta variegata TaxID=151549 RepID=A0A4C2A6F4_EUMVA|nr:hypothetical protein EVAR_88610_1 [Eumeta japonica]
MSDLGYSPDLAPCDFLFAKLRTNYAFNDFHDQKRLPKNMRNMFPRSPGRSVQLIIFNKSAVLIVGGARGAPRAAAADSRCSLAAAASSVSVNEIFVSL